MPESAPVNTSNAIPGDDEMRCKAALRRRRSSRIATTLQSGDVGFGVTQDRQVARMTARESTMHSLRLGSTGKGKTTLLELEIRQVIRNRHGVCVIDPHGGFADSLFKNILRWLKVSGAHKGRRVHIIDPSDDAFITGFNPLRGHGRSPSATAESTVKAFGRLFGDEDLSAKPSAQKMMMAVVAALSELNLTLVDAQQLLDIDRGGLFREWALEHIQDPHTHAVISRFHSRTQAARRDAEIDAIGPENRFSVLLRDETTRLMVAQEKHTLDLAEAMDRGDIILVNAQPSKSVGQEACQLVGLLLVRELFSQAMLRTNTHHFHLFIDECQNYIAGAEEILDQSRKFGLHLHLSTQRLGSLRQGGDNLFNAVMAGTFSKLIMGGLPIEDLKVLVEDAWPLDLERPVAALRKPTAIGQHKEWLRNTSEGFGISYGTSVSRTEGDSRGGGTSTSENEAYSYGGGRNWQRDGGGHLTGRGRNQSEMVRWGSSTSDSQSWSSSESTTEGESSSESWSWSEGKSETFVSDYKVLATAVHSLANVVHMTARDVKNLKTGEAVVLSGERDPAWIRIPKVEVPLMGEPELRAFKHSLMRDSPFCVPIQDARANYARLTRETQTKVAGGEVIEPESFKVIRDG